MQRPKVINPYAPLQWHLEVLRSKAPILLLTGTAGGGKSRVAAEKMHGFMLHYPGATGLMMRKARQWATKSIVPFMEKTVIGHDPHVHKKKTDSYFDYHNGSMLYWGGMKDDEQRESLRSIGQDGSLDITWIEEGNAFSEADFEEVLARMRGKAAGWTQVIITTNPDRPSHWIYQRLIKGGQAHVVYSTFRDNPYNPPEYPTTLSQLTGARRDRLYDGKWTQSEGLVYSDYDANIHLIDSFEIPKDWRKFRVIDFGFTNPFVCLWGALSPDDDLYVYREIYMTGRIVEDHAAQINQLSIGEAIEETIADHDAEDRATLHRHGINTTAADKDITTGIQEVQARLRLQDRSNGTKRPRLFIMRGCLVEPDESLIRAKKPYSIVDEIDGYVWQKSDDDKPVKEAPVKLYDHAMDSLRYLCKHLAEPPGLSWEELNTWR